MAFQLTERARLLSQQTKIEPQIILTIEGIDLLFGAVQVTTALRYGSPGVDYGDEGIIFGGVVEDERSRDWISIGGGSGGGTSRVLSQQLLQDKGGVSSVGSINIKLLNKDNQLATTFIPGVNIPDILTSNANVYLAFQGSAFPEDAIKIFQGVISNVDYGSGYINLSVSHPEELKRQEIYTKIDTELTSSIDNTVTTIPVLDTSGVFATADDITSYIRIEDELMQVITINPTDFEVVRGSLGTTNTSHDNDTEVSSFYTFTTTPIFGALKLMISGGPEFYKALEVITIGTVEGSPVNNSIFFESLNLNDEYGVTAGDTITITGASEIENDVIDRVILSVNTSPSGSYLIIDGDSLTIEGSGSICSFKSRFNVLSDGLGMLPQHVDIDQHLEIQDTFSTSFPDYLFYLKDTINGIEFLSQEMYFPANMFSIPRKGRASVGFTSPPLSSDEAPAINETNILNIDSVKISRSINKFFYNGIVYKYNEQLLQENFIASSILFSQESINRIPNIKNRPMNIESKGLRNTPETNLIIDRLQNRLIDRYKFSAKSVRSMQILYKDGFNLEVGDIISFAQPSTRIIDPDTGEFLDTKLFEISNKKLDYVNGLVTIDITDTNFSADAKFGVVSPSSEIDTGSSSTVIKLKRSFTTDSVTAETIKWQSFIGSKIKVIASDFSFEEEVTIDSISPVIENALVVTPALSIAPSEGYFVELADFDDSAADNQLIAKNTHCFINPTTFVVSGSSSTTFVVSDASDLLEGQVIKVHNVDFTNDSPDTTIIDITGTTITVEDDLGFTPSSGELVELIGFLDGTSPYRII